MPTAKQVGTRPQRLGALVKAEFWTEHGWCREVTEDIEYVANMQIGSVLLDVDDDGTWQLAVEADLTAPILARGVRILVDNEVYDDEFTVGTDYDFATIYQGSAILMEQGLIFGDTPGAGPLALLIAQLEAQNIKVEQRV